MSRNLTSFLIPPVAAFILVYQVLASLQIAIAKSETLVVLGGVLAGAVLVGAVAAFGGERVRIAVLALSILLFLDIALHLPLALTNWSALFRVAGLLALGLVTLAMFWLLRERIHSVVMVFLLVVLVTTIIGQGQPKLAVDDVSEEDSEALILRWAGSGRFDEQLPIVLHLVFDEMMSPAAITDGLPGGTEARRRLHALGEKHGFRTYDAVYSRDFYSGTSLPNLFSGDYTGAVQAARDSRLHSTVAVNGYFDDMRARGYRTMVFQTPHLNFCAHEQVAACETLDSFDPGGEGYEGLDLQFRILSLWHLLLRAYEPSYATHYGLMLLSGMSELGIRQAAALGARDRYDVQKFPAWFDRFTSFVAGVPRGTHVFGHFMVPHSPYLLTENCDVRGRLDSGYYLASRFPDDASREEARLRYYSRYLSQLQCLERKIDELMSRLAMVERFRDAIVLVHGDHGSRISAGNTLEEYSRQDFIDNYATYFAVRAPGVEPGVDCRFMSLPEALRGFMSGREGETDLGPLPVIVSSRERGGSPVEAAMPRFGCAGQDQ